MWQTQLQKKDPSAHKTEDGEGNHNSIFQGLMLEEIRAAMDSMAKRISEADQNPDATPSYFEATQSTSEQINPDTAGETTEQDGTESERFSNTLLAKLGMVGSEEEIEALLHEYQQHQRTLEAQILAKQNKKLLEELVTANLLLRSLENAKQHNQLSVQHMQQQLQASLEQTLQANQQLISSLSAQMAQTPSADTQLSQQMLQAMLQTSPEDKKAPPSGQQYSSKPGVQHPVEHTRQHTSAHQAHQSLQTHTPHPDKHQHTHTHHDITHHDNLMQQRHTNHLHTPENAAQNNAQHEHSHHHHGHGHHHGHHDHHHQHGPGCGHEHGHNHKHNHPPGCHCCNPSIEAVASHTKAMMK